MAVTAGVCNSYKTDILSGTDTSGDTYKMALYNSSSATLNASTTAYTSTGEVSGTGYTAGGATLSGFNASLSGNSASLSFTSVVWPSATITADTALIYNSSKSNKAVCVASFTLSSSTNGNFTVTIPSTGILQLS
jgi:hypothetical protein